MGDNNFKKLKSELPSLEEIKCPENIDIPTQKKLYYNMNLIRYFEVEVKDLWMQGKIRGIAHNYIYAEAIAAGACAALRENDVITSTHRGHGHAIAKGADVNAMMAELFGKAEGLNEGRGGSMHIADMNIGILGATGIVGSGIPLAAGAALSNVVLGKKGVAVSFHGDGSVNQGVWHETLNMAAVWNLPVIFITENNQMAVGTEQNRTTKEINIYKKAAAYGIKGVLADGFNVFSVYNSVKSAIESANNGFGPTLIECRYMRILGHFSGDDQWYRDTSHLKKYYELCPINRMRNYWIRENVVTEEQIKEIEKDAYDKVQNAIEFAENQCTDPRCEKIYNHLYAKNELI